MRTGIKATAVAAATAAVVIGLAAPAMAHQGGGMGGGMGGRGPSVSGMQRGSSTPLAGVASGTLTTVQKAELAAMAEEEKMAGDVYAALAAKYPSVRQFANIARSEDQHLATIRVLLNRYDIADPTVGNAAGEFDAARFQALFDQLLASATSTTAALQVGVTIEKTDIADLKEAQAGVTAPDVKQAYANLLAASEKHLAAFTR